MIYPSTATGGAVGWGMKEEFMNQGRLKDRVAKIRVDERWVDFILILGYKMSVKKIPADISLHIQIDCEECQNR